jgi:hypothetical protein
MKKIFSAFKRKNVNKTLTQEELIEFVKNKKNIEKAAEGSMKKRNDLIKRVKLRERNA